MRGATCEVRRGAMVQGVHALLLVVLLTGCAGAQAVSTRDPTLRLRERVGQYWDARIRSDLVMIYTLHDPAFRRAVTLTAFASGRGVSQVLDYAILGERIEGDLGVVKVKVKGILAHPAMMGKSLPPEWYEFEEQWLRKDGEWYRKYRFPIGEPYPPIDWDEVAAENEKIGLPPVQ